MKKVICFFLLMSLLLGICACSTSTNSNTDTASNTQEQSQEVVEESSDSSIITFTDVVLFDDKNVTIWIDSFYVEEVNWSSGAQEEKAIAFKAKNKTDHEISLQYTLYLNDERLWVCMHSGSTSVDAGRVGSAVYYVAYDSAPEHRALNSLDDLYKLNGSVNIFSSYSDYTKNNSYDVDIDLASAINGNQTATTQEESKPAIIYNIGDTVSTDIVEFTLKGFDYVYHLNPKTYAEKDDISGGSVGPGSDMVFANPEYEIKNISKEAIEAKDVVEFTVNYNDGFLFGMNDGHICYIVDSPGLYWERSSSGSGRGVAMTLSPLSKEDYDIYIPANEAIDTDKKAPLLLIVTIDSSTGSEEFTFKIR